MGLVALPFLEICPIKQERPNDFGSTDTETSANGDQILTDGWAGSKQMEKLGDILGN